MIHRQNFCHTIMKRQLNFATSTCHISNLFTSHYVTSANDCHVSVLLELRIKYVAKSNIYVDKRVILIHIKLKYKNI